VRRRVLALTRQPKLALDRVREQRRRSRSALVPEYPLELKSRWGWDGAPALANVAELLKESAGSYQEAIDGVVDLLDWAGTIPRTTELPGQPCWENDWWGTIDALMQCSALKRRNPATYLEVGSGFSTLFARRAIEEFGLRTRIVSIDPEPRAEVDACCDEVVRQPFEQVANELADMLEPDDVLLFDGSHVALMNSDATAFFLETLPQLPAGVLVGIDDVFLPWDYPPTWARRIYGEQYLLAALLIGGGAGLTVRFPGWWLVTCSPQAERFEALWPVVENRFGRHATSFWLETRPGANAAVTA
jgi:hypothetical protein